MKTFTWLSRGYTLLSLLVLLTTWQLLSFVYPPIIVPSPWETLIALKGLLTRGDILHHAGITIARGLAGFLLAVLIGVPLGLFMGLNHFARQITKPLILTIQVIPVISWLVLAMIWFGFNQVPIFIVFITTLPLVVINVVQGVHNVDPQLTEMATFYNVDQQLLVRHLYLPQVLPYIFAAVSAALGTTWKAVAMAEFLIAQRGIGAGMSISRINLETAEVFAWTLLLVLLGLCSEQGVQKLYKSKFFNYKQPGGMT